MYVVVESIVITLITLGSALAFALLFFLVSYIVLAVVLDANFHNRGDGSSCLKYFVASDFDGLNNYPVSFKSNKGQILRGYLYHYQDITNYKALVIFNHGIGSGHLAYTNIIYELAKAGYLVLAYDNTGCMLSEGKTMKSMIQGLVDIDYALDYVEKDSTLNKYKIYCVGHSMGGYISLNSLNLKKHHVDKVVSLAGFDTQTKIVSTLKRKRRQYFIEPMVFFHDFVHFGKYATYSSHRAFKNTNSQVYYIQGMLDHTVLPQYNGELFKKISSNRENIKVELIPNKSHNCYLSPRGEAYQIHMAKDYHIFTDPILDKNVSIDYNLITELDSDLMKQIINFLDK